MTFEKRVAAFFAMSDEVWMRHAKPWSVDQVCRPTDSCLFNLEQDMDRMVVAPTDYAVGNLDMDQSKSFQKAGFNE